jgi:hypothetical protein
MKTLKLFLLAALIGTAGSAVAQSAKADAEVQAKSVSKAEANSTFFVQLPHTKEQCMTALVDMKNKGDNMLSHFEYGCMSGDHTAYGFLEGTSVEGLRSTLPVSEQKQAKIIKVNKFTVAEIEKYHKEHM